MGTLFNQSPRRYQQVKGGDIDNAVEDIKEMAKKHKLTFDQVLKLYEIKELERRNDLFVANGDIHDEQMAGFGELLRGLSEALINIGNND